MQCSPTFTEVPQPQKTGTLPPPDDQSTVVHLRPLRPYKIGWLAHRVQRPHEKINHALVLAGILVVPSSTAGTCETYGANKIIQR